MPHVLHYYRTAFSVILLSLAWESSECRAQVVAFPGAEGFGAISVGGRGGDVYHVTSLLDTNSPGTLRHAINTAPSSGRTVVFDISGNIHLGSDLSVKRNKITIAGQSAPGQGITLTGDSVWLENNDLVVRYIRSRLTSTGGTQDSLSIQNGNRVIMDHCSSSWSADEITSMTRNSTDNTIQWSLITEALNVQNHSRSSLFRPGADAGAPFEYNLSVHHNLYAHSSDRNPVFATYNDKILNADFRNNVVFDWRNQASHSGDVESNINLNFVSNYYVAGLTTRSDLVANPTIFGSGSTDTRIYYNQDNLVDATRDDGLHNGIWDPTAIGGARTEVATPFNYPAVTTQSASAAYDSVLEYAGSFWWNRDPVDQRVITDVYEISDPDPTVRALSGKMLTTEADAGGLPVLPIEMRPADWDVDNDGMPGWWELEHNLDPNVPDHNGDFDADIYTNLEEYLNEVGAFPSPAPLVFQGTFNDRYARSENWSAKWQPSRFDTAVLADGTVVVDAVGQHAGSIQVAPDAGQNAVLDISSGWLRVADTLDIAAAGTDGQVNLSGGELRVGFLSKGTGGEFNFTGGVLSADTVGFDLVNDGGTLDPGDSPGTTHVMGDITLNSGSLAIELGGTEAGKFDQLVVDGTANLGGTLDVSLLDGFQPSLGQFFQFVSAGGGIFFEFANVNLPTLSGGNTLRLVYGETLVGLEVVAGLPGDFNGDGVVDGADFITWQRNPSVGNLGDWQANYGNSVTLSGVTAPEPSSLLLAAILIACAGGRWKRT